MKTQQNTDNKINELMLEISELKNKYLRTLADYQNLEKRTAEKTEDFRRYAAETLIRKLLTVLDSLEKAESHLKDPGLDLAVKEFRLVLTHNGVVKIPTAGREFDPNEMECSEVTEGKENTVVAESLPGYSLYGKVIRPAQVKVGRGAIRTKN